MKIAILLSALFASFAVNAAAPEECDSDNFAYQIGEQEISINHCYFRITKDGRHFDRDLLAGKQYVGIYDFTHGRWLLDPVHLTVKAFQKDQFLIADHGERSYRYFDLKSRTFTKSNISGTISFPYASGNKQGWSVFELDGDSTHIGLYNFRDGSIYKTLNNVDKDIDGGGGAQPIKPIYTAREGGYIVRQIRPDGSKFYKVYSDSAEELTGEIDASRVYPFSMSIAGGSSNSGSSYAFFEKVDDKRNLFWPIFFDDTTYLKRPDNVLGIRIDEAPPNLNKFNRLTEYIVEFSDSPYLGYSRGTLPENLADRLAFLSDQTRKLVGSEWVDLPTPLVTGTHYLPKKRIYVFENRIELPYLKKNFKDKAELQAFLDDRQKNIETLAADAKREYDQSKQASAAKQKANQADKALTVQEFIERMHRVGPNTSSLRAFHYDVGVYCKYRGPRCSTYQAQYRALENSSNQANELANQQRINSYASGGEGAPAVGTRAPSETTERYNAAVRSAAEKERIRIRDEQWRKKK